MPSIRVKIMNVNVKMIIDTAASITIIDENKFARISKLTLTSLKRTRTKLFAHGSKEQLPVIGLFEATLETKKRITASVIHVVKGKLWLIITLSDCNGLNLTQVNTNNVQVASKDKQYNNDPSKSPLKKELD